MKYSLEGNDLVSICNYITPAADKTDAGEHAGLSSSSEVHIFSFELWSKNCDPGPSQGEGVPVSRPQIPASHLFTMWNAIWLLGHEHLTVKEALLDQPQPQPQPQLPPQGPASGSSLRLQLLPPALAPAHGIALCPHGAMGSQHEHPGGSGELPTGVHTLLCPFLSHHLQVWG